MKTQSVFLLKKLGVPAGLLFFISFAWMGPVLTASAQTTNDGVQIPAQLLDYLADLPANHPQTGCVSGTLSPFTIQETSCTGPTQGNAQISTNCTTDCQAGGWTDYSSGYAEYSGLFSAPSNPTVSPPYSVSTTFSDWIGIQNAVSGSNPIYLLQAGEVWGESSSYPSNSPTLFEEFYESSNSGGGCTTWNSNCATLGTFSVSPSDSLEFAVTFNSITSMWSLYSQDPNANGGSGGYSLMYVTWGAGTYEIPYDYGDYGLTISEGQGTTAANQIPGSVSMYDVVGEDSSGSYQLGAHTYQANPNTGSQTITYSWSTGACYAGTCGTQDIAIA